MAPIRNAKVIYKEIPQGYPEPGKTTVYDASGTIDLDTVQLPPNSVLIKVLVLSIDPYIRGRMRDPKIPSYAVSWVFMVWYKWKVRNADDMCYSPRTR